MSEMQADKETQIVKSKRMSHAQSESLIAT